jgi:hypothetical protein
VVIYSTLGLLSVINGSLIKPYASSYCESPEREDASSWSGSCGSETSKFKVSR